MNQPLLSATGARHLAARLAKSGTCISGERLQELAAGESATQEESEAISHLMLVLAADYLNRGGKNLALIDEATSGVRSADDAVPAMMKLCGRLVGRVE